MSAYRCREHPDASVSWRGTGCWRCAAEAQRRKRRQEHPRMEWVPDVDLVDTSMLPDDRLIA